jgi:hypothetical protein
MPKTEERGADAELQYMEVSEDTKDPQANCANEGKTQCINLYVFLKSYITIYGCLCIYVQELKGNPRCMILMYLCPY